MCFEEKDTFHRFISFYVCRLVKWHTHEKIIPIIVIIMSSTAVLSAQDFRYDAGIAGGISCYMGDANQVSPWHRPGAAISGVFRFC